MFAGANAIIKCHNFIVKTVDAHNKEFCVYAINPTHKNVLNFGFKAVQTLCLQTAANHRKAVLNRAALKPSIR